MPGLTRYVCVCVCVGVVVLGCGTDATSSKVPGADAATAGKSGGRVSGTGGASARGAGAGGLASAGGGGAGGLGSGGVGGVGGDAHGTGGSGAQMSDVDASSPEGGAQTRPRDPFNGKCTTARWANVSDECWRCYCAKCPTTLNKCNDDCFKGWDCGARNKVAVGVSSEFPCEGRAYTALCESDPVIKAAQTLVANFDLCLINSHNAATEKARACEAACNTTYSGDVCQRFPPP